MPRIFGVTIPDNKTILYSLPYLFGIGLTTSKIILSETGIDPRKPAKELSGDEINKIQKVIRPEHKAAQRNRNLARFAPGSPIANQGPF